MLLLLMMILHRSRHFAYKQLLLVAHLWLVMVHYLLILLDRRLHGTISQVVGVLAPKYLLKLRLRLIQHFLVLVNQILPDLEIREHRLQLLLIVRCHLIGVVDLTLAISAANALVGNIDDVDVVDLGAECLLRSV